MERVDVRQNVLPVEHETSSTDTRTTIDGRNITYRMTVLQQPVRARACGQGAKSSADRRPVDPPPIVELKIFEGENDVTFAMQANYFLFATLEQARPIAHGRVSNEKQIPPVLTGTPVAGMVYLDRPSPAGYFIFPDLSVRHEGKYRLSFSLYEELKNQKDDDKPDASNKSSSQEDSHVTHRLEVRSEPFIVYSAKKFPGLTESTSLSRIVAEQGCRVRIRRDVRMRRRDTKSNGKDWDDYEDGTAAARARMSGTPDPSAYAHGYLDPIARPRSASNTSHHSLAAGVSRRPSLQEMNQAFNHPHFGTAPHTPQTAPYSQPAPYGPTPPSHYQSAFVQQQASMPPPPPQFTTQSYAPPPPPVTEAPYGAYSNTAPQTPSSQYGSSQASYQTASQSLHMPGYPSQMMQSEHRRSVPQPETSHPPAHMGFAPAPPPPGYQSLPQSTYQQPAPPRPAPLEPRTSALPNRHSFELPPLNTSVSNGGRLEASSPASAIQPTSFPGNYKTGVDSHKRSYGTVFSDKYQDQPMRQGARPGSNYGPTEAQAMSSTGDDDDGLTGELDPQTLGMSYRRADGRQIMRSLPSRV